MTSEGNLVDFPDSVVDIPTPTPEGQTLVFNSFKGEITAIHNKDISDDYICEVVCNGKQGAL